MVLYRVSYALKFMIFITRGLGLYAEPPENRTEHDSKVRLEKPKPDYSTHDIALREVICLYLRDHICPI